MHFSSWIKSRCFSKIQDIMQFGNIYHSCFITPHSLQLHGLTPTTKDSPPPNSINAWDSSYYSLIIHFFSSTGRLSSLLIVMWPLQPSRQKHTVYWTLLSDLELTMCLPLIHRMWRCDTSTSEQKFKCDCRLGLTPLLFLSVWQWESPTLGCSSILSLNEKAREQS